MNFNKKSVLFLVLFFIIFQISSYSKQTKQGVIDSLENYLKSNPHDSNKIKAYSTLIRDYYYIGDTLNVNKAYEKATEILKNYKFLKGEAMIHNSIGMVKYYKGDVEGCFQDFKKALELSRLANDKLGELKSYNNYGSILMTIGKFEESIKELLRAQELENEYGYEEGSIVSLNNIGYVYSKLGNNKKSISFFKKALTVYEKSKNTKALIFSYDGLSTCFSDMKMLDSAIFYAHKSIDAAIAYGDVNSEMYGYMNLGIMYNKLHQFDISEKYLSKCLSKTQELGDVRLESATLINLAEVYRNINQKEKSLEYVEKAIAISEKLNIVEDLEKGYKAYAEILYDNEKYDMAYNYLKQHLNYRNTIYEQDVANKITELETKYQTEKNETQIKLLNKNKELNEAKIKEQQKIEYLFGFIIVILIVFSIFIFKNLQQKRKSNETLEIQNKKIEYAHNEIKSSINYARRIQQAILPSLESIKTALPQSFVYYQPKDVVAGDFYWFEQLDKGGVIYIAAADCTGHGVPGAMVSVVCSNALNKALLEERISETGELLDRVRELVIYQLGKGGGEIKDGMDISILKIDHNKLQVQWSGANSPLYYIHENELHTIKGDKQPIGLFTKNQLFVTHNVTYAPNTKFYLFTDGYADQFGGQYNKKLGHTNFKELLLNINNFEMKIQKQKLEEFFKNWKSNEEQTDDVCVIGVKI